MEHTESVTVDAAIDEVWPLVGDFRSWPKWVKDVSDVELDTDQVTAGTELVYRYRGRPARATVDQYEEGRLLGIGAEEKSWSFAESITLTPQGGQTEVTFYIAFEPTAGWAKAVAALLTPFRGPLLESPSRRDLEALRAAVEGASGLADA